MANNNVQNVKFLRNGSLYANREAALTGIQTEFNTNVTSAIFDGTAILARYGSGSEVKTLVGFIYFADTTNKSLTIIDVDGAAADVQALREEINAKLGNGVTSGNTVTAQLEALSGNNLSTSADTSVEGAKRYADELISELDYTDAAVAGEYVSQVSQADGKIAVVRTELPSFDDDAVAKKFVIAVDETKGLISTTKGSIESNDGTILLSDTSDGGVNFEVHIDGVSILKNASGELSVANSALIQYSGDGETINVSEAVSGVKTISSLLTVQKVTTGLSEEVKEQYQLVGTSGVAIGDPVKIYKDSHIVSITYITDTGDTHYQNLEYVYLDASGATKTEYVDISMLVLEAEFASGLTIENHVARGVVDPTSEKDSQDTPVDFLTVGADGFKISGIKDEIDRQLDAVVEDLDATVTGATSGNHITISIEELDGKLVQSGLTIEENDIASAADLVELSGKTVTAITSTNNSITASINDAVGNKTYNLETDASKIKMSGFTSDGVLSGITPASSITEAFGEVEDVIEENERVTSAALNDLNSRINTVSGDVETLSGQVQTLESSGISGITMNGTAVTVSNNVAPLVITPATTATTASGTEAITVATDANGNVTLGLAAIDCGIY